MKKTNHPTTGQLIIKKLEDGRLKYEELASYIDNLLNKELSYGIHLGKSQGKNKIHSWSSFPSKPSKQPKKRKSSDRKKDVVEG